MYNWMITAVLPELMYYPAVLLLAVAGRLIEFDSALAPTRPSRLQLPFTLASRPGRRLIFQLARTADPEPGKQSAEPSASPLTGFSPAMEEKNADLLTITPEPLNSCTRIEILRNEPKFLAETLNRTRKSTPR